MDPNIVKALSSSICYLLSFRSMLVQFVVILSCVLAREIVFFYQSKV